MSPRTEKTPEDFHTPWTETLEEDSQAVVYWKDGCGYCYRLISALAEDDRITWVNVYKSTAAQPRVQSLNNGNLLTPTVIIGANKTNGGQPQVLINPSSQDILNALD